MTLRRRLILSGGLLLVILAGMLYVILSNIILSNFAELEQQSNARNVQRVINALAGELTSLKNVAIDYAHWDDMYAFVKAGNQDFITANFVGGAFTNLRLNLILVVKTTGEVTYGNSNDLANDQLGPVPDALLKRMQSGDRLLQHSFPEGSSGVVILPEGPMLIASVPILTSAKTGPSHGTLIFGRYLNSDEIERLGQSTQLPITVHPLADPQLPDNLQSAAARLSVGAPIISLALDTETVTGLGLLNDFDDKSALLLRIDEPRIIFQQGQNSLYLVMAALIVACLAFGLGSLLLLDTTVLTRVAQLSRAMRRLDTERDLTIRAPIRGRDELSSMAIAFNSMAAQLALSVETLEHRVKLQTSQLRASAEVGRAAASILDTERLLREVVNLITDRFGFYYAAIFLNDESNQFAVLHEATGDAGRTLKDRRHKLEIGGQSMVSAAITTRLPRIALDTGAEPVRFANPLLPETRSEIALPLIVGDRILGALDVQSTEASAFDETYASVLQSMADQIAIAVSNTLQFSQTEAALRQKNVLYEAARKIAVADNAESILAAIVTQAAPDAAGSALILFGPIDQFGQVSFLELAAVYSDQPADFKLLAGERYRPEQLPMAATTASSEPIVIEDSEKADMRLKQTLSRLGARAFISLPLIAGSQHLGALILSYRQPRSFSSETLQILQALASQAAVAVHSQQLLAETQTTLKQLDAINRRLTGEAWRDYTTTSGTLRVVDAAPGVPVTATSGLIASPLEADRVQVVGPIGDIRSGLIAPIALRGEVVGTLSLQEIDKDREWTENEITLLQTVANEVAVAIENARLIEQTERRAERERVIGAVSARMFAANDLHDIVKVAGDELARVLHAARTEVQINSKYLQSATDPDTTDKQNGH